MGCRVLITLALSSLLVPACGSSQPADGEDGTGETTGDGDGDGDTGDGDGDTGDGDGDGDTGDGDCPPPDPPLAQTVEGSWAELSPPSIGFDCTLESGDGPTWNEGLIAADGEAGVDHVAIGTDGKAYAAGWIDDGGLAALVVGVDIGNGPSSELWARSWTYDGDEWPARAMAATDNGRIWLNTAPEHLLAVGEGGELLDGPIEAFVPDTYYLDRLARGDGVLLAATVQRESPPNCLGGTRVQLTDQSTGVGIDSSPGIYTNEVLGLDRDNAGGAWLAILDLNRAGMTINHYDDGGAQLASFAATDADAHLFGGDLGVAANGDVILALRGAWVVEIHRYDPDGAPQWAVTLPDLGEQLGRPHISVDDADTTVVGFDADNGFGLARVQPDGSVDWAGHWACGNENVEVHDLAVSGNGADIWVGGLQASTAWMGNLQ